MDNEQNQQARINPNMKEKDQDVVKQILAEYDLYEEQSQEVRNTWVDCYDAYKTMTASNDNPYLSNLAIPKAHEATEMLTAFLVGSGQIVRAKPGNRETTSAQADFIQKLIQEQWDEELNAKEKVETWAKEGILLGTAVMKVGWLDDKDKELDVPFLECVEMPNFYADYFTKEMQEQHSVIHEIIKTEEKVKNDATYKNSENIEFVQAKDENVTELEFAGNEQTVDEKNVIKKVKLLEHWTVDNITTIAEAKEGWVLLRKDKNPYGFIPFVVFRYKTSPLPNRFYGIGAIEPALNILKAINMTINQMFDNITLINQKGWIIRRGASISPSDLTAKPGWVITCSDPRNDIIPIEVSDIKQSIELLYDKLDNEFQQATGAIDLLKGIPGSDTATEAAIGQKNATTLIDRVVDHYRDGLKELGSMLAKVNIENLTTNQTVKMMETQDKDLWLEVSPEELQNGDYRIEFVVDRTTNNDKVIMAKQLIDFLTLVANDPNVRVNRPKLYKKWLELQGFNDVDFFFEQENMANQMADMTGQVSLGGGNEMPNQGLPGNQMAGQTAEAMSPVMQPTNI